MGPLPDQVALELGEGGEDVKDEPPAGRRRVDRLGERPEADPALLERAHSLDQMAQ
jgi:hypothetical protein